MVEYERPNSSHVVIIRKKKENMEYERPNGSHVTMLRKNGNLEYERTNDSTQK